jgi:hypothetical protein
MRASGGALEVGGIWTISRTATLSPSSRTGPVSCPARAGAGSCTSIENTATKADEALTRVRRAAVRRPRRREGGRALGLTGSGVSRCSARRRISPPPGTLFRPVAHGLAPYPDLARLREHAAALLDAGDGARPDLADLIARGYDASAPCLAVAARPEG